MASVLQGLWFQEFGGSVARKTYALKGMDWGIP